MSREVPARLMATYVMELEESVPLMNEELLRLESSPADAVPLKALLRLAHALKGASRAVQMKGPEGLCHALETLLQHLSAGSDTVAVSDLSLLYEAVDLLDEMASTLRSGGELDPARVGRVVASLTGRAGRDASRPQAAGTDSVENAPAPLASEAPVARAGRQVRVDPVRLDALTSATTRLELWRGSAAEERARLETLLASATSMEAEWKRMSRERRRAGPRDDARHTWQDEERFETELRGLREELERLASWRQRGWRTASLAVSDVSHATRQLRMRPFSEACEGLPRALRDLAAAAGKSVRLEVTGGDVEVDRAILDTLRDAVLQLVRNAIDHGIEDQGTRRLRGKAATGCVRVEADLQGERFSVSVSDDGAGLDLSGIRAALQDQGLPVPSSDDELARAIFDVGVSTRRSVTRISGRGVGLEVVRHAAEQMRGSVDVFWEQGQGTKFTLTCPPTLTMFRAVTAAVGGHLLAVQTAFVEHVVRVRVADLPMAEGRRVLTAPGDGEPVPVVAASHLLPPLQESRGDPRPLLVLKDGERRLALIVDEVLSEQEILLRPFDDLLGRPRLMSGAALLGPRRIALVLRAARVIDEGCRAQPAVESNRDAGLEREPSTVLVVDDSITTRTLEQSILAAAGYQVRVAMDGAEAWRLLLEEGADLVVADVEMPRMDGFQLCEAIRGSSRFRELPVVLVTALDSVEHRSRGMEAGADAYIVKSGFDQQSLLDTVRQLLG